MASVIDSIVEDESFLQRVAHKNPWFISDNVINSLQQIKNQFLAAEQLEKWIAHYNLPEDQINPKKIGLVMAGNLPLVGFHDWLCVFINGHIAKVKLSSKDDLLLPALIHHTNLRLGIAQEHTEFLERLSDMDAIIATGSNNSSRYFDYYFGKYPHIIRSNRTSIAVLDGQETNEDLKNLADDLFLYFGMGCRNVSKLLIPPSFNLHRIFENSEHYRFLADHNKYKNNVDYNLSLLLLNQSPHLANEFLILQEQDINGLFSPLSIITYSYYDKEEVVKEFIATHRNELQCIIGHQPFCTIGFGLGQSPALFDYADNVDTMVFLRDLQ